MALATRRSTRGDERGMALALVLFALVIMGALVSAAFVISRQDGFASSSARVATDAQAVAEAGLARRYATWDPMLHSVIPIWTSAAPYEWSGGWQTAGQVRYVDSVRRVNEQLFLVRSRGQRLDQGGNVLAEVSLAQWFRLTKPTIGVNAAMTIQDPANFNGNAFVVSGLNLNPVQWLPSECPPLDAGPGDDVVGVRSAVSTGVQTADADNVFGYPSADAPNDATITSETFQNFLDYTYTTLSSQPGVKVLPSASPYNGVAPVVDPSTSMCDRSVLLNLGEPFRNPPTAGAVSQCYGYFPVVHGTGSQTEFAAGNRGQGTLLIDGDLKLTGGFEWAGLVIVRGRLHISGNGNKITGAVLAEGANVTSSGALSGDIEIHYSKCAIDKAIGGATLARPLGQRAWAQIY